MKSAAVDAPYLGHGVGLRVPHDPRALEGQLDVDWVEVITENFFGGGGRPIAVLEAIRRANVPLVFHGVSMSIGSVGGPSAHYLDKLAQLVERFSPAWISDHLCWTSFEGRYSHDLLPLPYTEEALARVVANVGRVQEALGRPLLLENVSSYVAFSMSQMPEWEFLSEVSLRSGCFILLDLNNIIVSAYNHGYSAQQYIEGVPAARVRQFHLANHSDKGSHKFDDHRGKVPSEVWDLYAAALKRFGPVSSLVEWDEDVPSWELLRAEQREAARRAARVLEGHTWISARASEPPKCGQGAAEPTSLEPVQRLMFRAITWPTGVRDFLSADVATREAFDLVFASSENFDRVARVDVYADAYFYRLLSALRDMFPRLAHLTGEVAFHNLVTDYVLVVSSTSPDLRRAGDALPAFLGSHELSRRVPFASDVAELELRLNQALDCPDGERLTEPELAQIPAESWPGLRFTFATATSRLSLGWDVVRIFEACDRGERAEPLALAAQPQAHAVLVGRRGHAVYFRALGDVENRALRAFEQGATLGQACEALAAAGVAFVPSDIVQFLRRWLADEVIGSVLPNDA